MPKWRSHEFQGQFPDKYNLNQEEDDIVVQGPKDTSEDDAEDKREEGGVGKGEEEQVDI